MVNLTQFSQRLGIIILFYPIYSELTIHMKKYIFSYIWILPHNYVQTATGINNLV